MRKQESLGLFIGTSECNAKCKHCAGIPLRNYAPVIDGIIDEDLIIKTIKESYSRGARKLSISSSGEPTLSPKSVTKIFELLQDLEPDGIKFSSIHMYSNGIRIGSDKEFCDKYLSVWRESGLDTMYITVHDTDETKNAKIYGIETYPRLETVVTRLHDANLYMRANIVLSKNIIGTYEKFVSTIKYLSDIGVDKISAWQIRNMHDKINEKLSPSIEELYKMNEWIQMHKEYNVKLLLEDTRIDYDTGKKLTLFPNGILSNTWCNR